MYKQKNDKYIIKLPENLYIPVDTDSCDYREYLLWAARGNTILPADPEPVFVPREVTMRQARLALHRAGLLTAVNNAINSLPEPARTEAQIEWEFSNAVQRNGALVASLAPSLGLTSQDLDNLFITASSI